MYLCFETKNKKASIYYCYPIENISDDRHEVKYFNFQLFMNILTACYLFIDYLRGSA